MSAMGGRFDGLDIVDLYAGSGALGLECLSRGARHCTFVDAAGSSLRVLEANVRLLGATDEAQLVRADVERFLDRNPELFVDVAVADPPYDQGLAARLLNHFARHPFARQLWVEHAHSEAVPELPGLTSRRYGDTTLTTLTAAELSS